jgi:acetylornithine deacetylase/succinyl-diaminopimelate desuccinylase-like protein
MTFNRAFVTLAGLLIGAGAVVGQAFAQDRPDAPGMLDVAATETVDTAADEDIRPEPLSADAIRAAVDANRITAVTLFREFLSLPNDAYHREDIENLVRWMEEAFKVRGFHVERVRTAGNPVLFGSRPADPALPTVLIYLQADGQPVDRAAWSQADPFLPVLKSRDAAGNWEEIPWPQLELGMDPDWRIFARSASDSKGPMTQFLTAIELLDAAGFEPSYNLKVLVDTEEEQGSPNLPEAIRANRELFAADMLLIFDGPPHASNGPTVSFGARGIATVTLTTYGPRVAQHSGHYGNFVPNPAQRLAGLLASMKSDDGRVTIEGFYDGIEIDADTRAELAAVPDDEDAILAAIGVAESDSVAPTLQEALQYPSLNIRGLSSAWVGNESRTIIPPTATAELALRLVKESDPERLVGLIREHIEEQGYLVIDREPTDEEREAYPRIISFTYDVSYGAFRSDFDAPPGRMARAGLEHLNGEPPILIRTMGGSIPIAPIIDALDLPAATVPTVNIDNNQHSPNENLRLGNFFEGIAMLMAVLSQTPPSEVPEP